MRTKEERSKQDQTNNKAKQHSTPKAVTFPEKNEHVHVHVHARQLIFSRKSDCLGCAVLLCLFCLFDLSCFFLSSFSSLIYTHIEN